MNLQTKMKSECDLSKSGSSQAVQTISSQFFSTFLVLKVCQKIDQTFKQFLNHVKNIFPKAAA